MKIVLTQKQKARIRLWIAALRSGKFLQGTGNLKKLSEGVLRYCCLGVACEVAVASGLAVDLTEFTSYGPAGRNTGTAVCYRFDSNGATLPLRVMDWFGFTDDDPVIESCEGYTLSAIRANDTKKLPFDLIADLVEAYYLPEDVKEATDEQ